MPDDANAAKKFHRQTKLFPETPEQTKTESKIKYDYCQQIIFATIAVEHFDTEIIELEKDKNCFWSLERKCFSWHRLIWHQFRSHYQKLLIFCQFYFIMGLMAWKLFENLCTYEGNRRYSRDICNHTFQYFQLKFSFYIKVIIFNRCNSEFLTILI